ncbi:MAG: hypothetical protein M3282_01890, partial [Gemmatimonadota bacterium]|nr:hypothetical protein [Gemmatimonadota bacterium]
MDCFRRRLTELGATVAVLALGAAAGACAPRLRPLVGAPAPARLPRAELPHGYRRIVFTWE